MTPATATRVYRMSEAERIRRAERMRARNADPGFRAAKAERSAVCAAEVDRLTWARISAGIKQTAVAAEIAISPSLLCYWETGRHFPSPRRLREWRTALHRLGQKALAA